MQAIKQRRESASPLVWLPIGATTSSSSTWAFDRLRLYYPTDKTRVVLLTYEEIELIPAEDIVGGSLVPHFTTNIDNWQLEAGAPQQFSSTNHFEHDFTFDLSFLPPDRSENAFIYMQGIPAGAKFSQLYAYPTGYSATRNKNAQLEFLFSDHLNPEATGGAGGILRLENQSLGDSLGGGFMPPTDGILRSTYTNISNCKLLSSHINDICTWHDNSGLLNGTIDYRNNRSDSAPYHTVYNSLLAKGWTLLGHEPY